MLTHPTHNHNQDIPCYEFLWELIFVNGALAPFLQELVFNKCDILKAKKGKCGYLFLRISCFWQFFFD